MITIFKESNKILKEMGLKYWLEAGTCLGAIREGGFISYDNDMDFGVMGDERFDDIVENFTHHGFILVGNEGVRGAGRTLSVTKSGVKVDLFAFYDDHNGRVHHQCDTYREGLGKIITLEFDADLFESLNRIVFYGEETFVPYPTEDYLEQRYGDWQHPDKMYDSFRDPCCVKTVQYFLTGEKKDWRIVYTAGVFDLFHIGHLNILKRSKALGELLVVGVISDEGTAAYKDRRPVIPQKDRLAIVKACRYVDAAVIQETTDPTPHLEIVKPHIFTHGSDWSKLLKGQETIERLGIQYVTLPYTLGVSTTQLRQ